MPSNPLLPEAVVQEVHGPRPVLPIQYVAQGICAVYARMFNVKDPFVHKQQHFRIRDLRSELDRSRSDFYGQPLHEISHALTVNANGKDWRVHYRKYNRIKRDVDEIEAVLVGAQIAQLCGYTVSHKHDLIDGGLRVIDHKTAKKLLSVFAIEHAYVETAIRAHRMICEEAFLAQRRDSV